MCYINKAIFTKRDKRESQKLKQNNKKKKKLKKKKKRERQTDGDAKPS